MIPQALSNLIEIVWDTPGKDVEVAINPINIHGIVINTIEPPCNLSNYFIIDKENYKFWTIVFTGNNTTCGYKVISSESLKRILELTHQLKQQYQSLVLYPAP